MGKKIFKNVTITQNEDIPHCIKKQNKKQQLDLAAFLYKIWTCFKFTSLQHCQNFDVFSFIFSPGIFKVN